MTNPTISDETLMALADSELPPAEAAALRSKIAADPALASRFAAFVETRMLLQETSTTVAEATPRRLVDAILRHDNVVVPASNTRQRRWRLPMAAAIAFALGGLVGSFVVTRDAGRDLASAADILSVPAVRAAVAQALDRAASGSELGWSDQPSGLSGRVLMVATQQLNDGAVCREFEVRYRGPASGAVVAASCRHDDTWRMAIAVFRSDSGDDFRPASDAAAVEQYLTDLGSSGALSAEDEQAAMAQGWRTRR